MGRAKRPSGLDAVPARVKPAEPPRAPGSRTPKGDVAGCHSGCGGSGGTLALPGAPLPSRQQGIGVCHGLRQDDILAGNRASYVTSGTPQRSTW